MTTLIRLTTHPDTNVILAHTPPAFSKQMGRFEPARWSADHKGYLIPRDLEDSFRRFVEHVGGQVIDERRATVRPLRPDEFCAVHVGERADHCKACAADLKAGQDRPKPGAPAANPSAYADAIRRRLREAKAGLEPDGAA